MTNSESLIGKEGKGVPEYIFADKVLASEVIKAGSGRELIITVNPRRVVITDKNDSNIEINAHRDGFDAVAFSLRTESVVGDSGSRHPDLYAKRLHDSILDYFERTGRQIKIIARTLSGSKLLGLDRYYQEFEAALVCQNPNQPTEEEMIAAIKQTDAYKLSQDRGYTIVKNVKQKSKSDSAGSYPEITFDTVKG